MRLPACYKSRCSPVRCLLQLVMIPFVTLVLGQVAQATQIAGELDIPVPENWSWGTDTTELPAQLICANDSAEVLIFKSQLAIEETIDNELDLKASVDLVIDDVVLSLPDAQLVTSTGFRERHRIGFVLEFLSSDSAYGTPLRHRLMGILYRHPEGHQVLFTIWGKSAQAAYASVESDILDIQNRFTYFGAQKESVFEPETMTYWPLILVGLALLGLLLLRPRAKTG